VSGWHDEVSRTSHVRDAQRSDVQIVDFLYPRNTREHGRTLSKSTPFGTASNVIVSELVRRLHVPTTMETERVRKIVTRIRQQRNGIAGEAVDNL
jgi:hypothetical protein